MGLIPEVALSIFKCINSITTTQAGAVDDIIDSQIRDTAVEMKKNAKNPSNVTTTYEPFLFKLLRLESAGQVDHDGVRDVTSSNIAAGSDTTGITLSAMLWYIYHNPNVLAAIRQEIDNFAAEGQLSNPVTWKESQTMPYLQAVIMETLRMHPAVGVPLPRIVPKGGLELSGVFFPEGVCSTPLNTPSNKFNRAELTYGSEVCRRLLSVGSPLQSEGHNRARSV